MQKWGISTLWLPPQYCIRTDFWESFNTQTRRRNLKTALKFLRSGYRFTTVEMKCVQGAARKRAHYARACCASDNCVVRAYHRALKMSCHVRCHEVLGKFIQPDCFWSYLGGGTVTMTIGDRTASIALKNTLFQNTHEKGIKICKNFSIKKYLSLILGINIKSS